MRAADAQAAMAALPLRDFGEVFGSAPLLVLAPHPDDESLGCGGILLEAAARGVQAHIAWLTDGAASHPGSAAWPPQRLAARRREEAMAAAAILGVRPAQLLFLQAPDGDAPHEGPDFAALAARLAAFCSECGVRTMAASWIGDPHGDHGAAAKLARSVCARLGLRHYAYPVWGWNVPAEGVLPAPAGARIDVARHLPMKRRAIAAHRTQLGLIGDDPDGFTMQPAFLALFDRGWEVVLWGDGALRSE